MPEVYDYDDGTGDFEILPDIPEQNTFPNHWFELDSPSWHIYSK